MKAWIVLLWVALFAVVYDVHTNYVSKSQYDKMVAASQKAAEAAAKVYAERPVPPREHHYQLTKSGFRTFRFDPATGDTCIQLTTPEDWKRPETKRQECGYVDAIHELVSRPSYTAEDVNAINCLYDVDCPKPKKAVTPGPWQDYTPGTAKVVKHP